MLKGAPQSAKGAQGDPRGTQGGAKEDPRGAKGGPVGVQGDPREGARSPSGALGDPFWGYWAIEKSVKNPRYFTMFSKHR